MASDDDLVEIAREAMRELRDRLGQTIVLSSFTARGPLVAFALPSVSPIEIGVRPGSELPFQSTAQGRVMLAYSPRPFQERVLSQDIVRLTAKTITDGLLLDAEIGKIVKQGYAIAAEEAMLGVSAIAGPVFDQDDHIVATVAAVGSIQFLPAVPEEGMISDIKNCCDRISRRMGHGRRSSNVTTLPRATRGRRLGA